MEARGDVLRRYRGAVNIAVVVTGGMSETLQATPLLRTLRSGVPHARLALFCPGRAAAIAEGIPAADTVRPLACLDAGSGPPAVRLWLELRTLRLDAVVLCTKSAAARAAAYFAAVPLRFGPGGGFTATLLTRTVVAAPAENRAAVWLRAAPLLGVERELHSLAFEPGPEARRLADRLVHGSGFADGRLLVALTPGIGFAETSAAPAVSTGWDPERYAYLANQLAVRHGAGIVILGAPTDRAAVERARIDLGASATDLSGEIDMRIIAGVLARCDLFVGADTPLLHLAAAMGTPVVGLFGPTDGRVVGPYGRDHRVLQALDPGRANGKPRPRDWSAMEQIRVEDVLAGIEAAL